METIILYVLLAIIGILQVATFLTVRNQKKSKIGSDTKVPAPHKMIILDTCALIDGRIRDLVKAGFIVQRLGVPKRVIEELQFLADHGDTHKRSRARFGLDVVQTLQDNNDEQVVIIEGGSEDAPVDDVLVTLALEHDAALYTTDYNLNKVARIRGVLVLNVNELAHALRPIYLPGDTVTVKIVQKGEGSSQGVGYLEDGTMTVVDGASGRIGVEVTAHVERMLQTEAGKMVFATLGRQNGIPSGRQNQKRQTNSPKQEAQKTRQRRTDSRTY